MKVFTLLIFLAFSIEVSCHGMLTFPMSRSVRYAINGTEIKSGYGAAGLCLDGSCQWYTQNTVIPGKTTNCNASMRTLGTNCGSQDPIDFPCLPEGSAVPWCAPGTAPVLSPCGILSGGGVTNGRDMRQLDDQNIATWEAGSIQEIAWSIMANHGGGYIYRICKADQELTEECFQSNILEFVGQVQKVIDRNGSVVGMTQARRTNHGTFPKGSTWTRNPINMTDGMYMGDGVPSGVGPQTTSVSDQVEIPNDLEPGHYVLSWRWDAEQTKQVWAQCSDVEITNNQFLAKRQMEVETKPKFQTHTDICNGSSLGLDIYDCQTWVKLFDTLNGKNWNVVDNCRLDPCGCYSVNWKAKVICNIQRNILRITEFYLMGPEVQGELPPEIGNFTQLVAMSFQRTNIMGTLPEEFGKLDNLAMLWLNNNPHFGGQLPESFSNLKKFFAIELHQSKFSGKLPDFYWSDIHDCTLYGLTFDCPLPKGAAQCGAVCQ